jgi:hypothetical protein
LLCRCARLEARRWICIRRLRRHNTGSPDAEGLKAGSDFGSGHDVSIPNTNSSPEGGAARTADLLAGKCCVNIHTAANPAAKSAVRSRSKLRARRLSKEGERFRRSPSFFSQIRWR